MGKPDIVDLRGLSPAEREAAYKQIDGFSFSTDRILGETGLEAAEVLWDLPEDFPTSPAFPSGCPYREVI